ncbi:hypothetical protein [Gulosibacter molinativorax]|uniref:Secreted protein n=1 Tax=Gulosibacter molinativorax TaxID=256821 RepID=A0ABT7C7Q5_9MICO|nr:hypothetical protein [Gulosibacter molinativorax]MDJ1371225.1 hypothetical protein [Gulosibacter molinativorax]QUY63041.1 Hypotetical protein [Gulosibacter molinativorax]
MKSFLRPLAYGFAVLLLLSGCASGSEAEVTTPTSTGSASSDAGTADTSGSGSDDGPGSGATRGPTPGPETSSVASLTDFIRNTEWVFSEDGLTSSILVDINNGAGTGADGQVYTVGVPVIGDANGDDVPDVAIPLREEAQGKFRELWYVWLGVDAGGNVTAEQVPFPIGVTSTCGHVVNSVTATNAGFTVDENLRLIHDLARDCIHIGKGHQVREIAVTQLDGTWFPLQVAPSAAWGGFCPPSLWGDAEAITSGTTLLSAPASSAPVSVRPDDQIALFPVAQGTEFASMGYEIVAYRGDQTGELGTADTTPLLNCAFLAD